jgi:hypothetical protein
VSDKLSPERPVDEPLPDRPRGFRGPCLLCGQIVDQPDDGLCEDCDDDLFEESSR